MKHLFIIIFIIFTNNLFSKDFSLTKEEQLFLKNNPIINVGYTTDFAPDYMEYEGGVEGIIPDLYNQISLKLGIKFNYITNSWENTIKNAKKGEIDIIPMIAPQVAKDRGLLITNKLYTHLFRVFAKKDKHYVINSMEDLKGLKVAYVEEIIVLDKFLDKYKNSIDLVGVNSTFEAFNKVLNDKVDLAIVFNAGGQYMIKNKFLSQLKPLYLLEKLQIESVCAITPNKPILHSILTKALDSISHNEKLKILDKWTKIDEEIESSSTLLTKDEKKYLDNNRFNIYYNEIGWHPFIFIQNDAPKGISIDIWDEVVKNTNIDVTYESMNGFLQVLQSIKNDDKGLTPVTSSTDDRKKYASFTKPYASFPLAIVTNIKEKFLIDLKELEGKKVAVGDNYTAHKLLQKFYPKIDFVPVKDIQTALDQVANGKVYAAADLLPVINYELNRLGYTNLKISGTSKFNVDIQIMVNKKSEELIPILNKLIDNIDLKKKEEIINKWLRHKSIEKIDYSLAYIIGIIALIIIVIILYKQYILKSNEKNINKEKNRYQALIELSSDGIFILDKKGKVVHFSENARKMLGRTVEQMKDITVYDWDKKISPEEYLDIFNSLSTKPICLEREFTRKDNTKYIAGLTASLIDIDDQYYVYSSARDISKEKKILEEIKIEKFRFESMFKNHDSIMLLINPNTGNIVDANKSAIKFYGYTHKEFLNMNVSNINILNEVQTRKRRKEALEYKNNSFIFPHKLKNGEIKTVEVHASPIETKDGVILFSIVKDITKQKELENQIIREKDFISTIINSANAIIAVIDNEGRMFKVNEYAENFTGYSSSEISSEPYFWTRFLSEDKKNKVIAIIEEAKHGQIIKYFKNSWFSKDGEKKVFEWSNTLVLKDDGSMNYLVTIGIDITDKEKIQKQTFEQKEKFESIFKHSKDGIVITDLKTNFLEFNDAYVRITGFSRKELYYKSFLSFIVSEQIEKFKTVLESAIKENDISSYEQKWMVKDAKKITANMSISLLPDKKRLLFVVKDVSSIKQIEEQLRLASLGEMIGNIAHQWRQPLSIITTSASGLKLQQELLGSLEYKTVDETTTKIIEQATYLSQTIDSFRNFIKDEKVFKKVLVSEVLKDSLNLMDASLINNFINVQKDISDDLEIFANKNELQEAFINILTNAKDALTQNIKNEEDRFIFISTKKIDSSTLELKILDSGGGIPETILNKIFEPYFTTKHQSVGTGLGLSMTEKILRERHNFSISVDNEDFIYNKKRYFGASFTIKFTS